MRVVCEFSVQGAKATAGPSTVRVARSATRFAQDDSNIYAANFRDRPLALQDLIDGLDVD